MSRKSLWITAGKVEQFVSIRGRGRSPILFIHGGPGLSLLPFARDIARTTSLERDSPLVYWEQRGTGRSYDPTLSEDELTLDRIVTDCRVVVESLRNHVSSRPPLLVGHSWGSVIGLLAAARWPDLVRSVVGVAPLVSTAEGEHRSYEHARTLARQANDGRGLNTLDKIGPPPHTSDETLRQRSVLAKHGGVWYNHGRTALLWGGLVRMLQTPEYTWMDVLNQTRAPNFSLQALKGEIEAINLFEDCPRVGVPVWFITGAHDGIAPPSLVKEYVQALEAPEGKQLVQFEHSAHLPFLEEPELFETVIRRAADDPNV